jgi:arsenite methyltransferase
VCSRGLEESQYRSKLATAGFECIEVEVTRVHKLDDAQQFLAGAGLDVEAVAPEIDGKFVSDFIRATKPGARAAARTAADTGQSK